MTGAVVPSAMSGFVRDWQMSPGRVAGDFLYLTGMSGMAPDGSLERQVEGQIRTAFAQIGDVLSTAGLDFRAVVDVTSFHVGIAAQLPLFKRVWAEHFEEPYPAWTAVEVAGLATPGVVVELKAVAWAGNGSGDRR
ncbi:MAG: Rid family hydrolase [Pseudomonadota bacterium]